MRIARHFLNPHDYEEATNYGRMSDGLLLAPGVSCDSSTILRGHQPLLLSEHLVSAIVDCSTRSPPAIAPFLTR